MKNVKLSNESLKYLGKKVSLLTGVAILSGILTSCEPTEQADTLTNIDLIDTNEMNEDGSFETIVQKLDVPGEDFKLVAEYTCVGLDEDKKWRITSDKKMMVRVYTEGLPDDTEVYIDNIHMDTSIVATEKQMDGITQDSMDDRIHNSLMLGFPISDDVSYYGINAIEGQNQQFIEGSFHGFEGCESGTVEQKRYLESDYLNKGVYANHISAIYGLLVKGPEDSEFRGIDTLSDIYIQVCNEISFVEDEKVVTYRYDIYGNKEVIAEKTLVKENTK